MESSTMISMLASLNIDSDSWVSTDRIHQFNLTTDGNHYHNYYEQLLYFDVDPGVLKIKYYNYRLASSKFRSVSAVDLRNFTMSRDDYGHYGVDQVSALARFRNPKYGDIAYTVNSAGALVAAANIIGINDTSIETDADLDLTGNVLCYADGDILRVSGGVILPKLSGAFIEGLANETQILYREPKTIYTSDEYLFFDNINGIALHRY